MIISAEMSKSFEDVNKMNDAVIVARVEMNPSKLMSKLADAILGEVDRLVPYVGYKLTASLTSEDILKYLKTLTWMRCEHVQDAPDKAFAPYRNLYRRVEVPVLAYQLFIAMGNAFDKDYAIKFLPTYSIESKDVLSLQEMQQLSDIFLNLRTRGFASVTGMPNTREGELDFMAMCHVEEVVKSYRNSHPVYGFLAAFFAQQQLNEITGTMCRVVYGYDTDYAMYVQSIMQSLTAKQPEVGHEP